MEQPYVVVCTDLHMSLGPLRLVDAVRMATKMTEESECVFLPVPINLVAYEEKKREDTGDWRPGQYL